MSHHGFKDRTFALARWVMGIFGKPPKSIAPEPHIPPSPARNTTDPQDDPALREMEESLRELDWRTYRLKRERSAMRRDADEPQS